MLVHNPILPGFYPDPSLCAVGGDYYLINSTFAYFPGLPIFHSKDLCHWEQVGSAMDRKSQLPLKGCGHSEGLFAPTIRYNNGTWYVICTNVSGGGNYIVTADRPEGPWSEPHYLGWSAPGIDPSLFFDEDGSCYYIGTHENHNGPKYYGDNDIWIRKLDIENFKMEDEPHYVWNGALRDVAWPEGPHLYKKDGWYYIMYAEGGTGPHHSVCIVRSRNIFGPYENNFRNPIITHRHLGVDYPIQYVGHSDMIQATDGNWYMVMLAVRPTDGYTTLGRETFLARVTWEEDWPVVNPGIGRLRNTVEVNLPEWDPCKDPESYTCRSGRAFSNPGWDKVYDFVHMAKHGEPLGHEFMALREPEEGMYELGASVGDCAGLSDAAFRGTGLSENGLRLHAQKATLAERGNTAYLGIRQTSHDFRGSVLVDLAGMQGQDKAGFVLLQSNEFHVRVEVCGGRASVWKQQREGCELLGEAELETVYGDNLAVLWMEVHGIRATFGNGGQTLAADVDIHELSTEVAGGFVGCTVGVYATTEGREIGSYVDVLRFEMCKMGGVR